MCSAVPSIEASTTVDKPGKPSEEESRANDHRKAPKLVRDQFEASKEVPAHTGPVEASKEVPAHTGPVEASKGPN